jgi:hypothetical protein
VGRGWKLGAAAAHSDGYLNMERRVCVGLGTSVKEVKGNQKMKNVELGVNNSNSVYSSKLSGAIRSE